MAPSAGTAEDIRLANSNATSQIESFNETKSMKEQATISDRVIEDYRNGPISVQIASENFSACMTPSFQARRPKA